MLLLINSLILSYFNGYNRAYQRSSGSFSSFSFIHCCLGLPSSVEHGSMFQLFCAQVYMRTCDHIIQSQTILIYLLFITLSRMHMGEEEDVYAMETLKQNVSYIKSSKSSDKWIRTLNYSMKRRLKNYPFE